jgi:hypothetical protein
MSNANETHPADDRRIQKLPGGAYMYRGWRVEDRKNRHTIGGEHQWVSVRRGIVSTPEPTRKAAIEAIDAYWARLGR